MGNINSRIYAEIEEYNEEEIEQGVEDALTFRCCLCGEKKDYSEVSFLDDGTVICKVHEE